MKNVSLEYMRSMKENFRHRSHLRITLVGVDRTFTYSDDDIVSAKQVEDVDPLSRRLPIETFEFTLYDYDGLYDPTNESGLWNSVAEGNRLTVEWGL